MGRLLRLGALTVTSVLAIAIPAGAAPVSHGRYRAAPYLVQNPAAYSAAKRRAQARAQFSGPFTPLAPSRSGGSEAVVVGGLNQQGLVATDNASRNDGSPPDPTGAVGPNDYVEFVNSVVAVYSKSDLHELSRIDLDTFIGHTNDNVFDVQIQWDPQANRWFYLTDDCDNAMCNGSNYLAYGFSKSDDPTHLDTGWCNYRVETDNKGGVGLFDDFPKLGHNDTHLIFGTNVFDPAGNFVSSRVWTVPKPPSGAITGTCPTQGTEHYWSGPAAAPVKDATPLLAPANQMKTSDGDMVFTPVPADTTDGSANGYVVAADAPPGNQIMAWHVDSSGALVADGNISVSSYDIPAFVPQPGTSDVLDDGDTRLTQAVAHSDPDAGGAEAVWTQHAIATASNGASIERWYELLPANLAKRQEGNVSVAGDFVFNGAISPSMSGNEAVIEYNTGSASQLADLRASSRVASSPLGTMAGEQPLGQSTNADQDFTCPSSDPTGQTPACRWGDYSAVTPDPDPNNAHVIWGTNQLLGAPRSTDPNDPNFTAPHWVTRNFALKPNLPPIASFTVSPATAGRSQAVTFDGSASNDPDPGGGIASYAWDFDGNGTVDQVTTTPTVAHVYGALGSFTAKLVVTDSDDGLSSAPVSQTVTVQNAPPTAQIAFSPSAPIRGQTVSFSAAGSSDPDGTIVNYQWDLNGDGLFETNAGASPTTSFKFVGAGVHHVMLRVQDNDGATATTTATVTVKLPPRLTLALNPPKNARLGALLSKKGLKATAKCNHACSVKITFRIPRKLAKALRMNPLVGQTTLRIANGKPKAFKITVKKGARRKLAFAPPLALTVSGLARDSFRQLAASKKTVKIRR